MRDRMKSVVEGAPFNAAVMVLVVLNALLLGVETLRPVHLAYGEAIILADRAIVYAFCVEIALRLYAHRLEFFKGGWNVFDFAIVLVSLFASASGLAAVRAFRVLRILRLVTAIPRMRVVVSALFASIPGIASVGVVILIILYTFSVIAAKLYGGAHPELFGDVVRAAFTLFKVMTLEGWPDIADQVIETHPGAWAFFVIFLLVATFTMLNLFVAVVVSVVEEDADFNLRDVTRQNEAILAELAALRRQVASLAPDQPGEGRSGRG